MTRSAFARDHGRGVAIEVTTDGAAGVNQVDRLVRQALARAVAEGLEDILHRKSNLGAPAATVAIDALARSCDEPRIELQS